MKFGNYDGLIVRLRVISRDSPIMHHVEIYLIPRFEGSQMLGSEMLTVMKFNAIKASKSE